MSFGLDKKAAGKGLTKIVAVCEIRVEDILALPYNLRVTEDDDPEKVRVSSIPLPTVDLDLVLR